MSWTFIRSCRIQKRESRINCRAMHCFLWEWANKSNKRRAHLLSKFTKTITEHKQHSGYPTLDMGRFCDSTGTTNWARNGLKSSDWSYNCQNVTNRSTPKWCQSLLYCSFHHVRHSHWHKLPGTVTLWKGTHLFPICPRLYHMFILMVS